MTLPSWQLWWKKVSECGEPTFLIVGALALFMHLWRDSESRPLAVAWAWTFLLCIGLTISSKALGYAMAGVGQRAVLQSPSGHVAIATTFYGACAAYLACGSGAFWRITLFLGGVFLVALIAVSRLALGMHNIPEVGVAFSIGVLCVSLFASRVGKSRPTNSKEQLVVLLLLLVVARFVRVDGEGMVSYGTKELTSFSRSARQAP